MFPSAIIIKIEIMTVIETEKQDMVLFHFCSEKY